MQNIKFPSSSGTGHESSLGRKARARCSAKNPFHLSLRHQLHSLLFLLLSHVHGEASRRHPFMELGADAFIVPTTRVFVLSCCCSWLDYYTLEPTSQPEAAPEQSSPHARTLSHFKYRLTFSCSPPPLIIHS